MWDIAFAQAAQAPSGAGSFISFIPLVLIFVIFYLLLIRPQQKKSKEHREMLGRLKKNDRIMTSGGMFGKVIALTETEATVEVAQNVRVQISRPNISQVIKTEKASGKEVKTQ